MNERDEGKPTLIKMFLVAMNEDEWTSKERQWLDSHPKFDAYAREMADAAKKFGAVGLFSKEELLELKELPRWKSYEQRIDEIEQLPSDESGKGSFASRARSKRQDAKDRSMD
jgi:hypothetical protein